MPAFSSNRLLQWPSHLRPRKEQTVALKRVFISCDWHHKRNYRNLLSAFDENPANDIEFESSIPGDMRGENVFP